MTSKNYSTRIQEVVKDTAFVIGITLAATAFSLGIFYGEKKLGDHFPKYYGYESKAGNIGVSINGQIMVGPYKGKSIDRAIYEIIQEKIFASKYEVYKKNEK